MSDNKLVYAFGNGFEDGNAGMAELLGGKGANLAEMGRLGLPVPPGFTLTTEICQYFNAHDEQFPDRLEAEVTAAIQQVAEQQANDTDGHRDQCDQGPATESAARPEEHTEDRCSRAGPRSLRAQDHSSSDGQHHRVGLRGREIDCEVRSSCRWSRS